MFIQNLKFNNQIKNLKNTEHMTNNQDSDNYIVKLIRKEMNYDMEAIRNLGSISKSLLTGKNYHNTTGVTPGKLIIPANVEIQGNVNIKGSANGVPVGTIIMWGLETPPPPNSSDINDSNNHWYPCIGGRINNINIPDMRSRIPVGKGKLNGVSNYVNANTLLQKFGGELPLRKHRHQHKHGVTDAYFAEYDGRNDGVRGSRGGVDTDNQYLTRNISTSENSADTESGGSATTYLLNTYPYSTVVDYWIRVR